MSIWNIPILQLRAIARIMQSCNYTKLHGLCKSSCLLEKYYFLLLYTFYTLLLYLPLYRILVALARFGQASRRGCMHASTGTKFSIRIIRVHGRIRNRACSRVIVGAKPSHTFCGSVVVRNKCEGAYAAPSGHTHRGLTTNHSRHCYKPRTVALWKRDSRGVLAW